MTIRMKCKSQNSVKSKSIKNQYLPKVVVQEGLIHHQMVNQVTWVWQDNSIQGFYGNSAGSFLAIIYGQQWQQPWCRAGQIKWTHSKG